MRVCSFRCLSGQDRVRTLTVRTPSSGRLIRGYQQPYIPSETALWSPAVFFQQNVKRAAELASGLRLYIQSNVESLLVSRRFLNNPKHLLPCIQGTTLAFVAIVPEPRPYCCGKLFPGTAESQRIKAKPPEGQPE